MLIKFLKGERIMVRRVYVINRRILGLVGLAVVLAAAGVVAWQLLWSVR